MAVYRARVLNMYNIGDVVVVAVVVLTRSRATEITGRRTAAAAASACRRSARRVHATHATGFSKRSYSSAYGTRRYITRVYRAGKYSLLSRFPRVIISDDFA